MSITIDSPGVHPDMPEDVYHADPTITGSISQSMAKELVKPGGPALLRWKLDHPQPRKKVFDFGSAAHSIVLGTGPSIAVIPNDYLASNGATSTKAAKDFIAQAYADKKIPLKQDEHDDLQAMATQLRRHTDAMRVLDADGARHEVSAFAIDPATGLFLRGRFDTIAPLIIGDYKTAVSAAPVKFAKAAFDTGYHMQAAWYCDLAMTLGLCSPAAPFRFVVQEKTAPFLVSVIELDAAFVDLGRRTNRHAIDLYRRCLDTDQWPGYPTCTVPAPAWAGDPFDVEEN